MTKKGKGYGFSIERDWITWFAQHSEKFGSGFDVRQATNEEDTRQGFDMEINFYNKKKRIRIDITLDMRRKHVETWLVRGAIGWKSDRHEVLVVHANLDKAQVLNLLKAQA
ncbi:MAG: hypothetical protein ACWGQW_09845 [bacterium]